jgi:cytochrome c oxidase assembly protein subunit 11
MTNANGKNARVSLLLFGLVAGMIGLSFAAVPLYRLFCQVTGFSGTPQIVEKGSDKIVGRVVKIRFNSDTDRSIPWDFRPAQLEVSAQLGEQKLVFYRAHNPTARPITGTAVFNVTPLKVGEYFNKVECFCFTEQRLEPGQTVDMPVAFYVDPRLNDDPSMADVTTITLSYTFYRAERTEEQPRDSAQLVKPTSSRH